MRSYNIDILKAICAFLVICIHAPFPGDIGQYFITLTRIAVPIFFMITGYFYSDIEKKEKEIKQIKKIFVLILYANITYFLWQSFIAVVSQNTDFFSLTFSFKNLFKFLLLNESPFNGHLWYLGAILYVLIIVYLADKLKCNRILYWLTPMLLLGDLILGKYSIVLWNREFPYILVRNFLFVGIPYFCIGQIIRNGFGQKISRSLLSGLIVIFSLTSLLERFILINIHMNATRDHYISTTLLATVVFLFVLKSEVTHHAGNFRSGFPSLKLNWAYRTIDLIALIGRKYSTWIYILHPIFITCMGAVMRKIGLYELYRYVAPIVVYVSTLVFLMIVDRMKIYFDKRQR